MPSYFPNFDKLSQYNKDSATVAVRFGADAPLTENELNEIQLVQNNQRDKAIRSLFSNGVIPSNEGSIAFAGGTVTITNKWFIVDGWEVYVDSASLAIGNGESAYLNIWEENNFTVNDQMKKYGNKNGTNIDNYIMDDRYNQEISRRIQRVYALEKTARAGAKSLQICTNSSGSVSWKYKKVQSVGGSGGSGDMTFIFKEAKEIPLTWAEIKARCEANNFEDINIGDYKTITLTGDFAGTTIVLEVAGIDTYYGYGSYDKHHIDFVCRDILCKHRVHSAGGVKWSSTELYTYLNTNIYNSLPSDVRAVIGKKRILAETKGAADSSNWEWLEETKLWLLAELELLGYQSWSQIGYGSGNFKQYPLYMGSDIHRIKKYNGTAHWYWFINPRRESTSDWCRFGSGGHSGNGGDATDTDGGVVFGLRVS